MKPGVVGTWLGDGNSEGLLRHYGRVRARGMFECCRPWAALPAENMRLPARFGIVVPLIRPRRELRYDWPDTGNPANCN